MVTAQTIEQVLTSTYAPPHWLFGLDERKHRTDEWRLRQLTADIAVSGSREETAIKSSTEVWAKYNFDDLSNPADYAAKRKAIANIFDGNGVRFGGRKADYVLKTMQMIRKLHNGKVPTRMEDLVAFPGVGRHAAQVTQHLGHGMPNAFGVDLHVRRIAKRMGTVKITASDEQIEDVFLKACENPGRVSRAFVDFGKDVCQYVPQCNRCPFAKSCERVDFT